MCIRLPQLLASLDVKKRRDEENGSEQHHENVLHRESPDSVARQPAVQHCFAAELPEVILDLPEVILAHKQI
jgi:hypothetical protein